MENNQFRMSQNGNNPNNANNANIENNENKGLLNIVEYVINGLDEQRLKNIREDESKVRRFVLDGHHKRIKEKFKSKSGFSLKKWPYYIGFFGILVYCYFWYMDATFTHEDYYEQLIYNMNQSIIEKIEVLFDSTNCALSLGEDYEPLFQYNWPGTVVGCDCSQNLTKAQLKATNDETFFNEYFHIGVQCNLERINKKCKTINEIENRKFSFLNDQESGKPFLLCAKRNKGISLRDNHTYCSLPNKVICGKNDFQYCLPANTNCPITDIGFNWTAMQFDQLENITVLNVSENLSFYYYTNQPKMPISQIKMNENLTICQLNYQDNISRNRNDYYLMTKKRKFCEETDSQFQKVYNLSEEQFYLANNQLHLQKYLPYYQIDSDINWNLQIKPYIQISDECQKNGKWDQILNENPIKKAKFIHYLQMIILLGQSLLILILHMIKTKDSEIQLCCEQSLQLPKHRILHTFNILLTILIIPVLIATDISQGIYINATDAIISDQCFLLDVLSQKYFQEQDIHFSGFIIFYQIGICFYIILLAIYQTITKYKCCSDIKITCCNFLCYFCCCKGVHQHKVHQEQELQAYT